MSNRKRRSTKFKAERQRLRQEALDQGLTTFEDPEVCPNDPSHGRTCYVKGAACVACKAAKDATRYLENRDEILTQQRELNAQNAQRNARVEPDRTGTKKCSDCKEDKPKTEFGVHRRTKDGLNYVCKSCDAARTAAYKKTPAGRAADNMSKALRRATISRAIPFSFFGPTDEERKANYATLEARVEVYLERKKQGLEGGELKIRDLVSPAYFEMLKEADLQQACCQLLVDFKQTQDHRVALNCGGEHRIENFDYWSGPLNSSKGDTPLEEWTERPKPYYKKLTVLESDPTDYSSEQPDDGPSADDEIDFKSEVFHHFDGRKP